MTLQETKYLRNKTFVNNKGLEESLPIVDIKDNCIGEDHLLYCKESDMVVMVVSGHEDCRLAANSIHLLYPYNENTSDILMRIEQVNLRK